MRAIRTSLLPDQQEDVAAAIAAEGLPNAVDDADTAHNEGPATDAEGSPGAKDNADAASDGGPAAEAGGDSGEDAQAANAGPTPATQDEPEVDKLDAIRDLQAFIRGNYVREEALGKKSAVETLQAGIRAKQTREQVSCCDLCALSPCCRGRISSIAIHINSENACNTVSGATENVTVTAFSHPAGNEESRSNPASTGAFLPQPHHIPHQLLNCFALRKR